MRAESLESGSIRDYRPELIGRFHDTAIACVLSKRDGRTIDGVYTGKIRRWGSSHITCVGSYETVLETKPSRFVWF